MPPKLELDPERERRELEAYLGEAYDHERLVRYEEQLEDELDRIGDEAALYRKSEAYLYNLTAFAMTGTKVPYLDELVRAVPPGARLLDYGCGIGSDGLALLDAGYRVAFADFDNPSTRYLRWRLERRGLEAPVYDLDREDPPGGFDLAYSFDVIEHVDDPFGFLARLERQARLVLVNFLEPEPGETELHHELPIAALLRHAADRQLLRYRRHHGRSHLVLYGGKPAAGLARLRSLLALWRGKMASGSRPGAAC
jgi:SAM-dependent methyltransferase